MYIAQIVLLLLILVSPALPYSVVVIGGGWAGYTATSTLVSQKGVNEVNVTILEASTSNLGGGLAGGWRTPSGRPVEAGIHGFWREVRKGCHDSDSDSDIDS